MIAPRTCSCGSSMEWRPHRKTGHLDGTGAYFCAHCDRGCTRAEAACGSCRAMKVKR